MIIVNNYDKNGNKINPSDIKITDVVIYEIVKKYYNGENYAFTSEILAKFCYILDCEIDDILIYETSEDFVKQG